MAELHWMRPLWLLALPLAWAGCWWLARRQQGQKDWAGIIAPELLPALLLEQGSQVRQLSPWSWIGLAWTLALLALAGPSWQQTRDSGWKAPAAWVVLLDLSPSMAATDLRPDRATRARYLVNDVLDDARDARVALLTFSDEAYVVTPLTTDVATIRTLLPPLSPALMPTPGDALAPALERAASLLDQAGGDRRIILISDGISDMAQALGKISSLQRLGIELDVVGVGTVNGAPLPDGNGGFATQPGGQTVITRQDRGGLQQLARQGHGLYVDATGLPGLMQHLHPTLPAEADGAASGTINHAQDGGYWLLPALLVVAAVLSRRGWL